MKSDVALEAHLFNENQNPQTIRPILTEAHPHAPQVPTAGTDLYRNRERLHMIHNTIRQINHILMNPRKADTERLHCLYVYLALDYAEWQKESQGSIETVASTIHKDILNTLIHVASFLHNVR